MRTDLITSMMNDTVIKTPVFQNLLIVKDGKLVFEEYFGSQTPGDINIIYSCTKSFTSALVGIAIDQGLIGGVDMPIYEFFPEYPFLQEEDKSNITLQHVLTMTSGFEWNELSIPYSDPSNDNYIGNRSDSYLEYVLNKPVVDEPGTHWVYNSGNTIILAGIIRNVSSFQAADYAEQYLFNPLDITEYI